MVIAALGLFALAGCEAIAGIEERRLALDGGNQEAGPVRPPASALCTQYCEDVMSSCTGEFALYGTTDVCLAVCAALPQGNRDEPGGNTMACRAKYAEFARGGEPDVNCPIAGPGGSGTCGDDCESYCMLFEKACEDSLPNDCERKCSGLANDGKFDVIKHHDGDYMQCRLVHSSTALGDPDTHCWHATIVPAIDSPCGPFESQPITCDAYCDLVGAACIEDNTVYEDRDQCMSVCAELEPGSILDTKEDTVGCRRYHSYNSMEAPDIHCPHAGPGGDGHCGLTNCPAYCVLAAAACAEDFKTAFGSDAECNTACAAMTGADADTGYSIAATGNNVQCRLLNAARALDDPTACGAVFGGGECQ
jgi:hypothetical protein